MINEVILVGQMLEEPKVAYHTDGSPYIKFKICIEDIYREMSGDSHKNVISCIAYGNVSETIKKYFHKGQYIKIYGSLNSIRQEISADSPPYYEIRVWVKSVNFFNMNFYVKNKTESNYSLIEPNGNIQKADEFKKQRKFRSNNLYKKKEPKKTVTMDNLVDIDNFYND